MRHSCILPLAAAISALLSCSVKEDRSGCPCLLEIDISAFHKLDGDIRVSFDGKSVEPSPQDQNTVVVSTTKQRHGILVASSTGYSFSSSSEVRCASDSEPGELWSFHCESVLREEKEYVTAIPHKEYVNVTMYIEGDVPDSRLGIAGEYNGLDISSSKPLRGDFSFPPQKLGNGRYRFRLSRQDPDGNLEINYVSEGNPEVSLPLGEWIDAAGLDWKAEDLPDVIIGADKAFCQISLTITDWNDGSEISLKI